MKTICYSLLALLIVGVNSCDFQDEPVFPEYPWGFTQPDNVGFNSEMLLDIDSAIRSGDYGQLTSLVIVKNDNLVFENYYRGANRSQENQLMGSTASVVSILLGIALGQSIIPSLDTPIKDLLPNDQAAFDDPLRSQITIRNLITMKPGISWNELLRSINDPVNFINQMTRTSDWSGFTLEVPMEAIPGTRFSYNSGGMMILSKVLQEQAGMSLADFAEENLFQPLGISATWSSDPSGITNAAWGLSMSSINIAKIAYLCLNNGNWFGNQIVPSEYTSIMGELESQYTFNWDYGLGWWRFSDSNDLVSSVEKNDLYFSWGFGGQFIFVVPHLDMVVISTANNFINNEGLGIQLLMNDLIPALNDDTM